MSRGEVVKGERVGGGSIAKSFTVGSIGRQKEIKTSLFLRKGENPLKRSALAAVGKDDMFRYLNSSYKM